LADEGNCFVWQELEGANLDVAMAQHLLVAADRFQLSRLRQICERRLCETVEVRRATAILSAMGVLCQCDQATRLINI